ncbi:MAG: PH domain-containing protein [Planctomycetota bacterium]
MTGELPAGTVPDAAPAAAPATAAGAVPSSVQSALSPGEIVVLSLRPSLFYIPLSSLGTLVASALIGALLAYSAQFRWSPWSDGDAFFVGGTVAGLRLAWAAVERSFHAYVLTDRRIIARRGVFRTVLYESPLARIQNTIVVQSMRERVFGLGTLGFATAGRGTFDAFWEMLPAPLKVHRTVLDTIERYARRGGDGT